MHSRRVRLWVAGSIIASIGVVLLLFGSPSRPVRPEPVYQGKTLSKWLNQLDDGQAFGITSSFVPWLSPSQREAANAIRAIGTNALPLLMEDIHATPAPDSLRVKLDNKLNNIVGKAFPLRRWFTFSDVTPEDRIRWRAAQGLSALGPLIKPCIPELERLLYANHFHSSIKEAAYALAAIGPEGVQVLTNAVRAETSWSGTCAIWALGQHPETSTNAIPFLLSATVSPSQEIVSGAVQVLGLFHTDAGSFVLEVLKRIGSEKHD